MAIFLRLLVAIISCFAIGAFAGVTPPLPDPPSVGAKSYLLVDFNSGQTLAELQADTSLEPASLTKLMSAYVVFKELEAGNIQLTDQVTISETAWRTIGSRMFVEVGSKVSVKDLLQGMIIQSGNDATVALAEYIAGGESTFAAMMNQHALALSLAGTHFVNSTGLPAEEHYSTARDIARITSALIREFPQYYSWYSTKEFTYNDITQYNRNKLLWYDKSVDGVKTGHTDSAGYCLVISALRDDMRLISVVLGTKSTSARTKDSQALLNYGFRFFESHELYPAGSTLTQTRVWKGARKSLPLGLKEPLYVTVPQGQYDLIDAQLMIDSRIIAPVDKGQQLGLAQIKLAGKPLQQHPLIALEEVAEGSFWTRITDQALLYFQ